MLPVGLELGCELTRNANASSAVLWFAYVTDHVIILIYIHSLKFQWQRIHSDIRTLCANPFFYMLIALRPYIYLAETALRASPNANPPLNMGQALIFNGVFIVASASFIVFIGGKQARRELDEQKLQQSIHIRETEVA